MDILDRAKELGQMIVDSKEFTRYKEADIQRLNSDEANEMLKEYTKLHTDAVMKLRAENLEEEDMDNIRKELEKEYDKLQENPIVKEYTEAKKGYSDLVESLNDILAYYINGGDTNESSDCGCSSGGCSSCSGCH